MIAALAPSLTLALTLLFVRSVLSQMDVPTRTAYVMSAVTPPERAAAASMTAVPSSLAASLRPSLGGALFAAGWLASPLVSRVDTPFFAHSARAAFGRERQFATAPGG